MNLHVKGITNMTLLAHTCRCGNVCIDGFWNQLQVQVDAHRRTATVLCPCHVCHLVYRRRFPLTAGRTQRHRLLPWLDLFARVCGWIPARLWRPIALAALWLERRVPV